MRDQSNWLQVEPVVASAGSAPAGSSAVAAAATSAGSAGGPPASACSWTGSQLCVAGAIIGVDAAALEAPSSDNGAPRHEAAPWPDTSARSP